jgi:hypothetical protein
VKLKIRRLWVCLFPICAMACAIVTLAISPSHAQGGNGSFDVFLNSTMSSGSAGLYFVDARTGLSNIAVTNGTHHTLLETGVLFQENETGAIKIAYPDGRIELYPAIQPPDPKAAVNWIVSTDRKRIAWSVSKMSGTSTLSDLYTALSDGSDKKLVLHTSSTKNLIVVPLLITNDGTSVFYSRQIGTPGIYQLFPVAGDAFQLDVASGWQAVRAVGNDRGQWFWLACLGLVDQGKHAHPTVAASAYPGWLPDPVARRCPGDVHVGARSPAREGCAAGALCSGIGRCGAARTASDDGSAAQ